MKAIIQKFVRLGHHPDDSEEIKLKKSSLLVVAGPFAIAGLVWGVLYFSHGLTIPGSIPFSYGILSIGSMVHFSLSKQYTFFRNSQLFLILILPFALQISLGGFVPSSAVMYWAIIAPAGAMFFDSIKRSVYWFAAYLLLVLIAYLTNHLIPNYVNWDLSQGFIDMLFIMNIFGVSIIVFGILYYFVSTITQLNQDIEKKNEALQQQSEQLLEMDNIKSEFFANISHEFRTPLTLIQGLVNKQISRPDKLPEYKDSITIKRNAQRLLQLINQLLDLSKLESGAVKLNTSRQDLLRLTHNIAAQFESLAENKAIGFSFNGTPIGDFHEIEPINMFLDVKKMTKVLVNLLSNAFKFTPPQEKVAVEVEADKKDPQAITSAVIRVINTGVEIPKDKLPHIFDRFYQIESASNRRFEGTGIGLALVKDLVHLHGGTVEAVSKMNRTTFTIRLPMEGDHIKRGETVQPLSKETQDVILAEMMQPHDLPITSEVDVPAHLGQDGNKKLHILVVEDNPDLRRYIRDILDPGYFIVEAADGRDGLNKAISEIPDLIISDVMMPQMDGFELCGHLKKNEKTNHIPVILLTAKASRENKLEGLGLGADDYLVKPFDEQELKVRVRNLISIREQLQQRFQQGLKLKPHEVKVSSVHEQFIEQVKAIFETNIDNEDFGVEGLASSLHMSRSQLHRKLKAITGQSFSTNLRHYRLYRAADLLKQNAGNVTEIAFKVGFNSQTYFSSSFQDLFGCSPSDFRMGHGKP